MIDVMKVRLEYINRSENSEKFYEIYVKYDDKKSSNQFSVYAYYGRINKSGKEVVVEDNLFSQEQAKSVLEDQKRLKEKKGYEVSEPLRVIKNLQAEQNKKMILKTMRDLKD